MKSTNDSRQGIRRCAIQAALVACIALGSADTAYAQYPANPPYYFVTGLFQGVLGRQPDPAGWMFWIGSPPNAPGSLSGLAYSQVTNYFLTSQEYCNIFDIPSSQCPNSSSTPTNPPSDAQFLSLLYAQADNEPNASSTDPNYSTWLNAIPADTRATVVDDFIAPTYNGQQTTFDHLYGSFANSYCAGSITPTTFSPSNVILGMPTTMSFTYSNSDYCPGDFQYGVIAISTQGGVNQSTVCQITWYGANGGSVYANDSSSVCAVSAAPGAPIISFSGGQATVTFNLTLVASYFTGTQEAYSYAYDNHGVGTGNYTNLPTVTVQAPVMYTISGQVMTMPFLSQNSSGATPVAGVTIMLSGSSLGSAVTDGNGNYSFAVPAGGTYNVGPQSSSYSFAPSTDTVQSIASDSTVTFAASPVPFPSGCNLNVIYNVATTRTGGNQMRAGGSAYPNPTMGVNGSWSVTLTVNLLFTPPGGGQSTIATNRSTFSWNSSTTGPTNTETAYATSALQPYGAGTYQTELVISGTCMNYTNSLSPDYSGATTVQLPTVSGFPSQNAIWNFGPGTADPVPGYANQNIAQSASLTFNTNCNPGDTCTDTPQWSITSNKGQASLNSTSGSSVTLQKGSIQGDCLYDTSLSASMGEFSTSAYPVLVNSPAFIVHVAGSDNTIGYGGASPYGYRTEWTIGLEDACSPANGIFAVPMNESFSDPVYVLSGTSGWDAPNSALMTWSVGDWVTEYTFQDGIGYSCPPGAPCTPQATWTASSPPFTYGTVLSSQAHQFFSGTTTQSQGWRVYNGAIEYYQDHGDNTCISNSGC